MNRWWSLAVGALLFVCGCEASEDASVSGHDAVEAEEADTEDEPSPMSYDGLIQPIYVEWCADCHAGEVKEECMGEVCFATTYDHLVLPSVSCDEALGFNVAQCGQYRIEASKDPNDPANLIGKNGPIILPDDQVDMLRTWIYDLGMPRR